MSTQSATNAPDAAPAATGTGCRSTRGARASPRP